MMSITLPKGLRFQPSEEDLLRLLGVKNQRKDLEIEAIISVIKMLEHEPRDLPARVPRVKFLIREWEFTMAHTPDMERYFYSPRVFKHSKSKSTRSDRTTEEGNWKKQGKDRRITRAGSDEQIGGKRILTFYLQEKQKTDWVIHEYYQTKANSDEQIGDFVLCRLKNKSGKSDHDQQDDPLCDGGEPNSGSCSMVSNVEDQGSKELGTVLPIPNGNNDEAEHGGGSCSMAFDVENQASKHLENDLPIPNGNDNEAEHDKDAPFFDRGSTSCSMASNVENQAEENWASIEQVNVVPIHNGNGDEAETGGGMITEEEEYLALKELENALQSPIGNPHEFQGTQTDPCHIDKNDLSTSVEGRPDKSNLSDMIEELLDDPENLDSLFDTPAPPQLHQPPMYTTNDHNDECRKRAYPFEDNEPSLVKKNNISTNDDDELVSKTASSSENQAANMIQERYSQQGANLGSDFDSFLPKDYDYTLPSINGGPGDFPHDNNFIEWDDLPSLYEGMDYSPAKFSHTVIDGGRGVTSDGNTEVVDGSVNDYSALATGATLQCS